MSWQGKVRLFNNVPFDLRNHHTRWFTSKSQQNDYFSGLGGTRTLTDMRYVNLDEGFLDVQDYADSIDNINYAIIENYNTGSSNSKVRTYFVFITKVEYRTARNTRLHFEIDVLQTYMFDLNFHQSFVERQHLNSANRTLENIDTGSEYINISSTLHKQNIDEHFNTLVMVTTKPMDNRPQSSYTGSIITNISSPLYYYLILVSKQTGAVKITYRDALLQYNVETGYRGLQPIYQAFYDEDYVNAIVGISYLPQFPFKVTSYKYSTSGVETTCTFNTTDNLQVRNFIGDYKVLQIDSYNEPISNYIDQNVKGTISSYMNDNGISEPKLRHYPFARVVLRDNMGNQLEMQPQYIDGNNLKVDLLPSISSMSRVAYRVKNYKTGKNMTNALVSAVNADVEIINDYTATYIQGKKNSDSTAIRNTTLGGLVQVAGGIGIAAASGGTLMPMVAGAMAATGGGLNIFNAISSQNAKEQDMKNIPPTLATQQGAGNIMVGYGYAFPQIDIEVADVEYLKRADSFMKKYGHAVKDMVTLNLRTRTHYNFIKTIGCNVTGTVPQIHLDKVRNIFDEGVTLWHVNDLYNYNVNNKVR